MTIPSARPPRNPVAPDRAPIHAALDVLLDALDECRRGPPQEELLRVKDLTIEARAVADLVKRGLLRTVTLGRSRWTTRSWLMNAIESLPTSSLRVVPDDEEDELVAAARRRAERTARRSA